MEIPQSYSILILVKFKLNLILSFQFPFLKTPPKHDIIFDIIRTKNYNIFSLQEFWWYFWFFFLLLLLFC